MPEQPATAACERCGMPLARGDSEPHWMRISRAWERLMWYALIAGTALGAFSASVIWWVTT